MTYLGNTSPGEYSLATTSETTGATGWIPTDHITADFAFNITGTWVGTITLQASNQGTYAKTRYSNVTTYTANTAPLNIPREVGRYIRLIFTAYTSGTAYVGFSKAIDANGQLVTLSPQDQSSDPTGLF